MNKVMIFAAGLGTRLRPLTDHLPKALVCVDHVPLLERLLLKLKAAGFTDITLNLHHEAEQIVRFLHEKNNFGLTIHLSDERDLLRDTGGGIRHALPFLEQGADGSPILIHNIDILSNVDLANFARCHRTGDAATLLVSERETTRYLLFDDNLCLAGWTNLRTGEVKSPYPDFNPARCHRFAFAGIHLLDPQLFPSLQAEPECFSIVDFYLRRASQFRIRACVKRDLRLLDIGKPETLAKASDFLKSLEQDT